MKKLCKILLVMMILMCALASTALASDYDGVAEELKTLGLFQGGDSGFDLDRAPTRVEAAVMMVRLLGAEEQALSQFSEGTITHPFLTFPAGPTHMSPGFIKTA